MSWRCGSDSNAGLVQNLCDNAIVRTASVRAAMLATDRGAFVPDQSLPTRVKYDDRPLPIGYEATISAPHMVGFGLNKGGGGS